jgi:hypothetical protein
VRENFQASLRDALSVPLYPALKAPGYSQSGSHAQSKARVFLGFEGAAEAAPFKDLIDKFSLPDHGGDNRALPAADVALEMKDLLPSPENQLSIRDRHRE